MPDAQPESTLTEQAKPTVTADYNHDHHEGARVQVDVHPAGHEGPFWRAYCPVHAYVWVGPWRLFRTKAVEDAVKHGV